MKCLRAHNLLDGKVGQYDYVMQEQWKHAVVGRSVCVEKVLEFLLFYLKKMGERHGIYSCWLPASGSIIGSIWRSG